MKRLIIKEITNNNFFLLEDEKSNKEELIFEFFSEVKPEKNDLIYLDEKIINKKSIYFTQPFSYELLGEGINIMKNYVDKNPTEYLILFKKNKKLIYKRIYG